MLLHNAADLANAKMGEFGLTEIGGSFQLNRAKRRAGCCRYSCKLITLSRKYIEGNTIEEVTDTILHEVAHALVGPGHGHNEIWKAKCREIGAKPIRCYNSDKVKMPDGDYVAYCPTCNREFRKHRKVKRQYWCKKCGQEKGRLDYKKVFAECPAVDLLQLLKVEVENNVKI